MNAILSWFHSRWHLPAARADEVRRYLEAESHGSTAMEIEDAGMDWGSAASADSPDSPLVIVQSGQGTFLQSRRFYRAESAIANRILALSQIAHAAPPDALLDPLFPDSDSEDRQKAAARMSVTQTLSLITGGPGTGKTYTLARILALLAASGVAPDRIFLAAPTGKAADRMKKAIADSLPGIDRSFQEQLPGLARLAETCSTLHSLLGYNPGTGRCRFDAQQPLGCEVLIVDECSMVDVLLWQALLAAVPANCRLILLGDPNQLESVGQGNVFAELARLSTAGPLAANHVHLTEARRFRDRPAILELSRALERADADAAVQLLTGSAQPGGGVSWMESTGGPPACEHFPPAIRAALEAVATAATPEAALSALNQVCVLTSQREYFVGAKAISAAIDAFMAQRPGARNHPVIINENDPETGLRNGTVGIFHRTDDGGRRAYFPAVNGGLREIAPAKLPAHSPAWAITIHRSQGSEYDAVLVILPQEMSPMATRELLYTAITRARREVHIVGTLASVRKAVLTPSTRRTLLAEHLRSQSANRH